MPRRTTAAGRLARLGFADPARAELLIADLAMDPGQAREALIGALATAADPDLALAALARIHGQVRAEQFRPRRVGETQPGQPSGGGGPARHAHHSTVTARLLVARAAQQIG